ncbi:hypothetical protein QQZ08_005174 [Neonectria magnoliae]|uniref:Nucleoside phosphorylase domain-containing protein n=1 Tax=Neonectria magnoliae TaxID=2732573 RepID=A0ABR1I419_9HYPO
MEPTRPTTRLGFNIAIICALTIEADAVEALFDHYWDDDGPPYDKAPGDPNAYSTGSIGRHNVVLAYMPGMGKVSSTAVAANCHTSFPNIKLALVVGVCGAVPFVPSSDVEIVLGDVIMSSGVIQYDLGRQLPERFVRKNTLQESLGRPNAEVRALLAKLEGIRARKILRSKMVGHLNKLQNEPELEAKYPGVAHDKLFNATYRHISDGKTCEECGCNGELVLRRRFDQGIPQPAVYFGLIASGDKVMKSGEERDDIARQESVIGFEMEGAGVWDTFPCIVIKGACDYADSHKTKVWPTTAACTKAFLEYWVPSTTTGHILEQSRSTGQDRQTQEGTSTTLYPTRVIRIFSSLVSRWILLRAPSSRKVHLLSKDFETVGRDPEALQAVAQTWILSFQQIEQQHALASELLSFMSILDRQDIPAPFISHYSEQEQNGGPRSEIELTEALGTLKAFSFVTEEKSGSFDMHRLVQLVTPFKGQKSDATHTTKKLSHLLEELLESLRVYRRSQGGVEQV